MLSEGFAKSLKYKTYRTISANFVQIKIIYIIFLAKFLKISKPAAKWEAE